jgi:hypothetical protein
MVPLKEKFVIHLGYWSPTLWVFDGIKLIHKGLVAWWYGFWGGTKMTCFCKAMYFKHWDVLRRYLKWEWVVGIPKMRTLNWKAMVPKIYMKNHDFLHIYKQMKFWSKWHPRNKIMLCIKPTSSSNGKVIPCYMCG